MAPSAKAKKAAKGKAGSATTTTTTTTIAAALSKADDAANKAVVSAADDKPKNEGDSAARPAPKTKDLAGSSPVTAELVLKASRALLKFLETQSASAAPKKPNLLDDEADEAGSHGIHNSEQVWLVVSTKKNLVDKKDLKPKPVKIPHPLLSPANTSALLLVKDPQRTFKDILLPSSPTVRKVLGLAKLRAKFKTYESLRQLRDTHDLVLGDERIIPSLRTALGSSFLKSTTKIPIPVRIAKKDGKPASQQSIEKEIKKAVEATYIHLSQTNSTNIRVGLVKHSAEQLMENAMAVIDCMITEKKIVKTGWKGIRGVYIKSGNSAALPLYLAPKLYDEEKDVITPEQRKEEKQASEEKKKEREERRKAKKARNTAAQKGISVATGATETKGANGVTAIEPAQKKRKADAELEKKEEVPKEELEGSPKAKKPKVLAVAKGKKASVEEKPTAPAEEAASTTKAKPSAQKGKKGKADAAEAPTPAAEEKKKEGEAGSTAGRAKAAKASKKASKPTTTSETDAPAAENPVEERKEESRQAEKPVAKAAGKKGKAAKGDSAAQEKVEGKKEEVKRRSKRVNTGGKA